MKILTETKSKTETILVTKMSLFQALRSENRRLAESLDQKCADSDEEVEQLKSEIAALKQQSDSAWNLVRRQKVMIQERETNGKHMDSMKSELESLRRVSFDLRSQLAAAEAIATETRLRQLNQLKRRSAETEQLRRILVVKHQQRQQQQDLQLRNARLQHLGNTCQSLRHFDRTFSCDDTDELQLFYDLS